MKKRKWMLKGSSVLNKMYTQTKYGELFGMKVTVRQRKAEIGIKMKVYDGAQVHFMFKSTRYINSAKNFASAVCAYRAIINHNVWTA